AALGRLALEPPPRFPDWPEAEVVRSLRAVPSWVVERVHGAVELTLAGLVIPAPPVTGELTPPPDGAFGFAFTDSEAEAVRETRLLAQVRPGLLDLVADLTAAVAADEALTPFLTAEGDEAAIAAAHGGAYLSIALVTTAIAAREAGRPGIAAI
ncbi:hypothetical protein GTY80_25010, partial [Amycolatopsis sp. SID8362]|nr:hypothetical protein [Amycolatopsis sp. SID8362]NED43187.1 hypothetical protein [Amycolatopsis sp. SID8362]